MKKTIQLLGITLLSAAALAACGDDTQTGGGNTGGGNTGGNPTTGGNPPQGAGGNGGDGVGGDGGGPNPFPPPPEPGAQIDRMGRPAINTALVGAFVQYDASGDPQAADPAVRAGLQDDYNADTNEADWGDSYGPLFIGNLAVIDALDTGLNGTTNQQACTNQAGHPTPGDLSDPLNYGTLGNAVLPDDRLYVSAAAEGCTAGAQANPFSGFLGLELATLSGMTAGCGGRRPIDDVIAVTYSLLTVGAPAGFDDGITPRAGQHPQTFPYLAPPEQND